jgi:hypothetical protein
LEDSFMSPIAHIVYPVTSGYPGRWKTNEKQIRSRIKWKRSEKSIRASWTLPCIRLLRYLMNGRAGFVNALIAEVNLSGKQWHFVPDQWFDLFCQNRSMTDINVKSLSEIFPWFVVTLFATNPTLRSMWKSGPYPASIVWSISRCPSLPRWVLEFGFQVNISLESGASGELRRSNWIWLCGL